MSESPFAGRKIAKVTTSQALSHEEDVTRSAPSNMVFSGSSLIRRTGMRDPQHLRIDSQKSSPIVTRTDRPKISMSWINNNNNKEQYKEEEDHAVPWRPADRSVRPIPRLFPLESTSTIVDDAAVIVIASRVFQCCRVLSVEAIYDDSTATARLRTMEHVEIHVALWRGSGPPRFPKNCILVELQRCAGDIIIFNRYARYLLAAVKGNFDIADYHAAQEQMKKRVTLWRMGQKAKKTRRLSPTGTNIDNEDNYNLRNHVLSVIANCSSLLQSAKKEDQIIGMDLVCMYSDCGRVDETTAMVLSQTILQGHSHLKPEETLPAQTSSSASHEDSGQIRKMVLLFLSLPETNDADDDDDSGGVITRLRCSSLTILFNVFENFKSDGMDGIGDINTILAEWARVEGRNVISDFLAIIDRADKKTHEAYFAARALYNLCLLSSEVVRRLNKNEEEGLLNVQTRFRSALKVGQEKHAKLESEIENLFAVLKRENSL